MWTWSALVGVCIMIVSGISILLRARTGPPGSQENGAGFILMGLGMGLNTLRTAAGWTGAAREATAIVGLLLIMTGAALIFRAAWKARVARRSTRSA